MIPAKTFLPHPAPAMARPNFFQLIRQGAMLHYATVNSCLRISKDFREKHGKAWPKVAIDRLIKECGMNIALFFSFCIVSQMYVPNHLVEGLIISFLLPPVLSATQVAVDYIRPDGLAYFDPNTKAGLSVKIMSLPDGTKGWQFYNHFAFPVGYHKGRDIRQSLHGQADTRAVPLACVPQNDDIKSYYAKEHPNSVMLDSKMMWDYR